MVAFLPTSLSGIQFRPVGRLDLPSHSVAPETEHGNLLNTPVPATIIKCVSHLYLLSRRDFELSYHIMGYRL
jgi:hypothetical protein